MSLEFLNALILALQMQRNMAWDSQAQSEAANTVLKKENAELKAAADQQPDEDEQAS